ncbi:hypothetical protein, partial [Pseudomonas syringae]|uniref:hypothetical protein n=1 Tax=Pseudomonas syringae TaxID=317 RepID=UPI001F0E6624
NLNFVLKLCVRQLNYRATLRVVMPFRTLRVLLRRRASRTAFPRWSVRNDNLNFVPKHCVRQLNYRATLRVVMPFRTLRVLFATQSVANCIPTLERAER